MLYEVLFRKVLLVKLSYLPNYKNCPALLTFVHDIDEFFNKLETPLCRYYTVLIIQSTYCIRECMKRCYP